MTYEVNGRTLEANENGYLVNQDDWDKDVAEAVAAADGLTLTQDHWDVIEYLRDTFINHNGEQPNNRAILKAMQDKWSGRKVDNKTLFDLYPGNPSKSMRIEDGRMAEFIEALESSANPFQRAGILGYIGSVNSDQAVEADRSGRGL